MSDTLLLNQDGQPLCVVPPSTIPWQTAIKAVFMDKVVVVKNHDDWYVRSQKLTMPVPSIVMIKKYVKNKSRVSFNRKNLFMRDNYTCQYCGEHFDTKDLTIDHVVPKSLGGTISWSNAVTCCKTCNYVKGAELIDPLTRPREPAYWDLVRNSRHRNHYNLRDPAWAEYLGWDLSQIEEKAA